ncbi:hypothetical protein [Polyangium mundeleinium]|uniref:Uncharacterized protein n=1 Tax=Polyangium mundeleinium TaxID=2995306 RepID=A0ABT5EZ57_9BACT|nr:hypothetical protein [Polyangium mundeleinium]MDC0746448.1 hypothetical protein [Polyangium mundeleinium]
MDGTREGPYRAASPGRPHGPEAEAAAASELARRAMRLNKLVIVPCISLGLVLGVAGYFLLRQLQLELIGRHVPWVTGVLGVAGPLSGSFYVASRVSAFLMARRRGPWIEDVAARYGVPVEALEDYTALL